MCLRVMLDSDCEIVYIKWEKVSERGEWEKSRLSLRSGERRSRESLFVVPVPGSCRGVPPRLGVRWARGALEESQSQA